MRPSRILYPGHPDCFLEIEKLNILIGKNGAGKTRILTETYQILGKLSDQPIRQNIKNKLRLDGNSDLRIDSLPLPLEGINPLDKIFKDLKEDRHKLFFRLRELEEPACIGDLTPNSRDALDPQDSSTYLRLGLRQVGFPLAELIGGPIESWLDPLIGWLGDWNGVIGGGSDYKNDVLEVQPDSILGLKSIVFNLKQLNPESPDLAELLRKSEMVLCVLKSGGAGSLAMKIPRSRPDLIMAILGVNEDEVENLFPQQEFESQLHGISWYAKIKKIRRQSGYKTLPSDSFQSLPRDIFSWDGDLLLPLVSFIKGCPEVSSTFVSASTEFGDDDIESLVITWASEIAELLCDRYWSPKIDWLYRLGKNQEIMSNQFATSEPDISHKIYRIHPAILIACRFITQLVSESLPDFISNDYAFQMEPVQPEERYDNARLRYGLVDKRTGSLIELENAGAGIRRWTLTTLSMLEESVARISIKGDYETVFEQMLGDSREELLESWDSSQYYWGLWSALCEDSQLHQLVNFSGLSDGGFLLIDEPEANLHPEAIESVKRWLVEQAVHFGTVIVATHDQRIFDITFPSTARYHVRRSGTKGMAISRVAPDPSVLAYWQEDIGLSAGQIFLATKRWVFVEGEVDKIVIQNFFGQMLEERGVRVLAARGSSNFNKLFQVELVRSLSGSVSVLLDQPAPNASGPEKDSLRESMERGFFKRDLGASVGHGGESGVLLGIEELSEIDMMFYLDSDIINANLFSSEEERASFGRRMFPGWANAWGEFADAIATNAIDSISGRSPRLTVSDFKRYLSSEFGLRISPWFVDGVSRSQAARGLVPAELRNLVDRMTSPFYGEFVGAPRESL